VDKDAAETFVDAVVDQLGAAVAAGDPDVASAIIDRVHDDGYPAAAAVLDAAVRGTSLGPQLAEEPPKRKEARPVTDPKFVSYEDLRQAINDSRTAGQRPIDLIEMVLAGLDQQQPLNEAAAADRAGEVDHTVQLWLEAEIEAGRLIEHNGRYYAAWTASEFQSATALHRAAQLDDLAAAADVVSEAVENLSRAWTSARVGDDPLLRGQLRAGYPFKSDLAQLAGEVRFWTGNVRAGVEAAAKEPHACAAAIRQHLRTLGPHLDRDFAAWSARNPDDDKHDGDGDSLSSFYESVIRNGLGGVFADVAASASPAFMSTVADLLDHAADSADPRAKALAERVAAVYRASRGRDDER
jgi:hypothetical protein